MIPISRLDDSLERVIQKIIKEPKDWVLFAIKQAEGIFKDRLFSDQGGRAKDGSLLPTYSEGYTTHNKYGKRKTASHWDLVATGDLMGDIKPNVKKDTATLEFSNSSEIKKAQSLEKRAGKVIFEFSKTEMKEVIDKTVKEIRIDIRKIIKESFR